MSTQTLIRTGTLPRVNLLPPEFGERARLRKTKAGLGAGVAASLVAVVALFVAATGQVSSAQDNLDATTTEGASLQSQTAKYADIPAAIAKVDAADLQRTQAMASEIRWSRYLNDLSLRIPSKVWLTTVTVAQAQGTAAIAGTYPEPGIGTVTFEGKAYGHRDVATWLRTLPQEKGWIQPVFTASTVDDSLKGPGGHPGVTFSSQVTVTEKALSHRFEQKAGS
jgi:Tfp pilus assembly protein PilN